MSHLRAFLGGVSFAVCALLIGAIATHTATAHSFMSTRCKVTAFDAIHGPPQ